jgi:hypothetical protein
VPINPEPQEIQEKPHELSVYTTTPDVMVTVQIHGLNGLPDGVDEVALDLADYLQAWPGRNPESNVMGTKYRMLRHDITPTEPVEIPGEPNLSVDP